MNFPEIEIFFNEYSHFLTEEKICDNIDYFNWWFKKNNKLIPNSQNKLTQVELNYDYILLENLNEFSKEFIKKLFPFPRCETFWKNLKDSGYTFINNFNRNDLIKILKEISDYMNQNPNPEEKELIEEYKNLFIKYYCEFIKILKKNDKISELLGNDKCYLDEDFEIRKPTELIFIDDAIPSIFLFKDIIGKKYKRIYYPFLYMNILSSIENNTYFLKLNKIKYINSDNFKNMIKVIIINNLTFFF